MPSAHLKLDPQTVEAIARRVVQLLGDETRARGELVDAAEVARRLGVDRSWVYTHAIELGAVRLGGGARPRLRFDPRIAVERIRKRAGGQDTREQKPRRRRDARPSSAGTDGPTLLRIKGGGTS